MGANGSKFIVGKIKLVVYILEPKSLFEPYIEEHKKIIGVTSYIYYFNYPKVH